MTSVFGYNLTCKFASFFRNKVGWHFFKMSCHDRVLPKLPEVCLTLYCLPLQVAVGVYPETKEGSGISFAPKSRGNEMKSIQAYYIHAIVCHSASQLWALVSITTTSTTIIIVITIITSCFGSHILP